MALVKCPGCGNMVSDEVRSCPQCGWRFNNMEIQAQNIMEDYGEKNQRPQSKKMGRKAIVIFLLLAIAAGTGFSFYKQNQLTPAEKELVQSTMIKIANIEIETANNDSKIVLAENAYKALNNKCKRKVKNRTQLEEARTAYDLKQANEVIAKIDIFKNEDIALVHKSTIEAARKGFNALSDTQKSLVENYSALEAAEYKIEQIEAEKCISLINQIGVVSLESYRSIKLAKDCYEELTPRQKALVTNADTLTNAAETLIDLQIKTCTELITTIGEVSLESKNVLQKIENIYSKLPVDIKPKVENYSLYSDAKAKYDELVRMDRVEKRKAELRNVIQVSGISNGRPNSAGGVDVYISFTNKSNKTIKYVTWVVQPRNAVGDIVECEIRDRSKAWLSDTGPYAKNQGHGFDGYWDCVWYNSTIKTIELVEIEIEYTDGTFYSIGQEEVPYICN